MAFIVSSTMTPQNWQAMWVYIIFLFRSHLQIAVTSCIYDALILTDNLALQPIHATDHQRA